MKYGRSSMRQHSIIYREPGPCWTHDSGATLRHKRAQANSGHIYSLAPFTIYGAEVVALNTRYEGPPSNVIVFKTKEGGHYYRLICLRAKKLFSGCRISVLRSPYILHRVTCPTPPQTLVLN